MPCTVVATATQKRAFASLVAPRSSRYSGMNGYQKLKDMLPIPTARAILRVARMPGPSPPAAGDSTSEREKRSRMRSVRCTSSNASSVALQGGLPAVGRAGLVGRPSRES